MYSDMLRNDEQVELSKVELKREWWDLSTKAGINEFLKDITAMANTPGDTGYIILGVDKTGQFYDSPIPVDSAKIRGIVCKHIQEPIDYEIYTVIVLENTISIIEITPSLNKPHVIKEYTSSKGYVTRMFIPIRKSTSINPSNKYDIDFMYFEKNRRTVVDYGFDIITGTTVIIGYGGSVSDVDADFNRIDLPVTLINKGVNVNCITGGKLVILDEDGSQITQWELKGFGHQSTYDYLKHSNYFKVKSNDLERISLVFGINQVDKETFERRCDYKYRLDLVDIIGNVYFSQFFKIGN